MSETGEKKLLNPDCKCTSDCARHGDCKACWANHEEKGTLTFCQRAQSE